MDRGVEAAIRLPWYSSPSLLLYSPLLGKAVHLPLPLFPFIQNGSTGACFAHVRLDSLVFQTFF